MVKYIKHCRFFKYITHLIFAGVHLFDAMTGKALNDGKPWEHKVEIAEVALDQVC